MKNRNKRMVAFLLSAIMLISNSITTFASNNLEVTDEIMETEETVVEVTDIPEEAMPDEEVEESANLQEVVDEHTHNYTYQSNNDGTHTVICDCGESTSEDCPMTDNICTLCGYEVIAEVVGEPASTESDVQDLITKTSEPVNSEETEEDTISGNDINIEETEPSITEKSEELATENTFMEIAYSKLSEKDVLSLNEEMLESYPDYSVLTTYDVSVPEDTIFPVTLQLNADVVSGQDVFVLHFNGTQWEEIAPDEVTDGYVTATFCSLSPIAIISKEETEKVEDESITFGYKTIYSVIDNVKISVTGEMPETATLCVKQNSVKDNTIVDGEYVAASYDISIFYDEGKIYEPEEYGKEVNVLFCNLSSVALGEISIKHETSGGYENMANADITENLDTVAFKTESFSEYIITCVTLTMTKGSDYVAVPIVNKTGYIYHMEIDGNIAFCIELGKKASNGDLYYYSDIFTNTNALKVLNVYENTSTLTYETAQALIWLAIESDFTNDNIITVLSAFEYSNSKISNVITALSNAASTDTWYIYANAKGSGYQKIITNHKKEVEKIEETPETEKGNFYIKTFLNGIPTDLGNVSAVTEGGFYSSLTGQTSVEKTIIATKVGTGLYKIDYEQIKEANLITLNDGKYYVPKGFSGIYVGSDYFTGIDDSFAGENSQMGTIYYGSAYDKNSVSNMINCTKLEPTNTEWVGTSGETTAATRSREYSNNMPLYNDNTSTSYDAVFFVNYRTMDFANLDNEEILLSCDIKMKPDYSNKGVFVNLSQYTGYVPADTENYIDLNYDISSLSENFQTAINRNSYSLTGRSMVVRKLYASISASTYNINSSIYDKITIYFDDTDKKTYTVTFDSNNGTPDFGSVIVNSGDIVSKPLTVPLKENCTFKGWYLDGSLFDFNAPITEDITLKAMYDGEYTVLFKDEDTVIGSQTVNSGQYITYPSEIVQNYKEGRMNKVDDQNYTFKRFIGWTNEKTGAFYEDYKNASFDNPNPNGIISVPIIEDTIYIATYDNYYLVDFTIFPVEGYISSFPKDNYYNGFSQKEFFKDLDKRIYAPNAHMTVYDDNIAIVMYDGVDDEKLKDSTTYWEYAQNSIYYKEGTEIIFPDFTENGYGNIKTALDESDLDSLYWATYDILNSGSYSIPLSKTYSDSEVIKHGTTVIMGDHPISFISVAPIEFYNDDYVDASNRGTLIKKYYRCIQTSAGELPQSVTSTKNEESEFFAWSREESADSYLTKSNHVQEANRMIYVAKYDYPEDAPLIPEEPIPEEPTPEEPTSEEESESSENNPEEKEEETPTEESIEEEMTAEDFIEEPEEPTTESESKEEPPSDEPEEKPESAPEPGTENIITDDNNTPKPDTPVAKRSVFKSILATVAGMAIVSSGCMLILLFRKRRRFRGILSGDVIKGIKVVGDTYDCKTNQELINESNSFTEYFDKLNQYNCFTILPIGTKMGISYLSEDNVIFITKDACEKDLHKLISTLPGGTVIKVTIYHERYGFSIEISYRA